VSTRYVTKQRQRRSARGTPDLIQPLGWISAEAMIAASAGVAPRLSLL
jgi:hypothetical protein